MARRARLQVTKAILEFALDTTAIQIIKIDALKGEVFEDVERPQNYGLTSMPPDGAEVLLAEVGGSRDNPIALIVAYSADRPKGFEKGEVGLWSKFGQLIKHNEDNETEFTADKFLFNGGGRSGARKDDQIKSVIADDSAFWGWVSTVSTFINGLAPGTITVVPTSLTGKITQGSSSTELPDD